MEAVVEKFSAKGLGVVDKTEIPHVIPGDRIVLQSKRRKGKLLELLAPSPHRVEPKCIHATSCGGCCWQQLSYDAQLFEKQRRVEQAFGQKADPIIASPTLFEYRNKMEFTFSENRAGDKFLGLIIAQSGGHVFNLTECHLTGPWFAKTVSEVRTWWQQSDLHAYFPPADRGSLRYLTLRETKAGQKMAILNVSGNPDYALNRTQLNGFMDAIGPNVSTFLRIHQTQKGRPTQFYEMHLAGPDHITEEMMGLTFKISPSSFFQPNTLAAEKLYQTALSMLPTSSIVYDLYCGTGTLGMAASTLAKQVIGIELVPEAIIDAEENLLRNRITNMTLYQGDVGQILKTETLPKPDAIILDPPRIGLDPLALSLVKDLQAPIIIYVSCNPLTQAQNVAEFLNIGYKLKRLQPVDQFPHTYHIENIALLGLN